MDPDPDLDPQLEKIPNPSLHKINADPKHCISITERVKYSAQIITEGKKLSKTVLWIRKYFFRIHPDPRISVILN